MSDYGIYNLGLDFIVCDPIPDRDRLLDILARHGIPSGFAQFDGEQLFGNIALLPAIKESSGPPKKFGYFKKVAMWVYDSERNALVQADMWSKVDFDMFERDLYEHLAAEESRALRFVKTGYTDEAVETWDQQRSEADKWTADNAATVPLLQSQAAERGITVAELVEKVLAKANQAAQITGLVLGSVQGAGDKIEAIKAEPELPADWFDQMQTIAETWQANWPAELLGG